MKGLSKVTDAGITAVAKGCKNLMVLEVSNVKMTDVSAMAIGENLKFLQVRASESRSEDLRRRVLGTMTGSNNIP